MISRHDTAPGEKQRFIRNNRYFSICIYVFLLVLASAITIKAVFDFATTKEFLGGLTRAIAPFLIALLIAYILKPFIQVVDSLLHNIFHRINGNVSLVISLIIVYTISLSLLISLLVYILPEVVRNLADLIKYIPSATNELIGLLNDLNERFPMLEMDFSSITTMLQNVQKDLINTLSNIAGELIPVLYTASVSIVTWIGNFLIAIVVSVYMLYGQTSLKRILRICLYALVPDEKIPLFREIFYDCNNIFSQFLVSKMIDSLIIGIICSVVMSILRLPYVLLISLIVGVTNMIPYFGPFIGAIPGLVILLVIDPIKSLIFLIMIICLQQFDGLVLGPKLLGDSTGMKPIWIIFAITIGGKFWGVIGMFLGVPIMAIFAYLAERYMSYRLREKGKNIKDIH